MTEGSVVEELACAFCREVLREDGTTGRCQSNRLYRYCPLRDHVAVNQRHTVVPHVSCWWSTSILILRRPVNLRLRLSVCISPSCARDGSLSWSELARRTWREVVDDDVLGLAAQLSYYFFLALFPAILFLLAVASFFRSRTSPTTSVVPSARSSRRRSLS